MLAKFVALRYFLRSSFHGFFVESSRNCCVGLLSSAWTRKVSQQLRSGSELVFSGGRRGLW